LEFGEFFHADAFGTEFATKIFEASFDVFDRCLGWWFVEVFKPIVTARRASPQSLIGDILGRGACRPTLRANVVFEVFGNNAGVSLEKASLFTSPRTGEGG
jgi:hypothetical protein